MRFKKVLLVFPDYKGGHFGALRPPAGLGYIAQSLKKSNIEYDVIDMALGYSIKDLVSNIKIFEPELIGISLMSFMYYRSYEIIKKIKQNFPEIKIVAGGPHVSTFKSKTLEECPELDFAIRLEGEHSLVKLCKGEKLELIGNLIWREKSGNIIINKNMDFIEDLDSIGFPQYNKFELKKYVTEEIGIVSSRGCPGNCIYCPVICAIGRKWRKRSEDNIIEEIIYWYNKGYTQFSFLDDNFTLLKGRVIEFCEKLKKSNLKGIELNCNNGIRADRCDKELLKLMYEAGFRYIAIGVESANNKILENIKKGVKIEKISQAIENALETGLQVTLFFIIGSPGETMKSVKDSINFALKYPIFDARFYNLIPFPETELFKWVSDNNYFSAQPDTYLNNSSQWDDNPVFETGEFTYKQRQEALKLVRQIRKEIRKASMARTLNRKIGCLSKLVANIYVTDSFQSILMKVGPVRKLLKKLFIKYSK